MNLRTFTISGLLVLGLVACGSSGSQQADFSSSPGTATGVSADLYTLAGDQSNVSSQSSQAPTKKEFMVALDKAIAYVGNLLGLDTSKPLAGQVIDASKAKAQAGTIKAVMDAQKAVLEACVGKLPPLPPPPPLEQQGGRTIMLPPPPPPPPAKSSLSAEQIKDLGARADSAECAKATDALLKIIGG